MLAEATPKEQEYLKNFFKYTFFLSYFGYTIFGDKPVSFETINLNRKLELPETADYMDILHIFDKYKLKECWQAWEKFSHNLNLKKFTISSYKSSLDKNYLEFMIINHEAFKKVVKDNIQDFHKVLGSSFTPDQILDEYRKGSGEIFNLIRNHDALFGILLGYGKLNAWEYMRCGGGENMNVSFAYDQTQTDTSRILKLYFCVLANTKETSDLRIAYEKQRQEINKIYQSENFLELLLLKLTGGYSLFFQPTTLLKEIWAVIHIIFAICLALILFSSHIFSLT
jgi:hypothetical protein